MLVQSLAGSYECRLCQNVDEVFVVGDRPGL